MAIALEAHPHHAVRAPRPLWRHPNVLIIVAVVLGAFVGWLNPPLGANLKPLADAFIGFVKLLIAPIVFLVVVTGIAQVGDMRKVGSIGVKAFVYFEVTTTFALAIGLLVGNWAQPGAGVTPPGAGAAKEVARYVKDGAPMSFWDFFFKLLPDNLIHPFLTGNLVQILIIAMLAGASLLALGERGKPLSDALDHITQLVFKAISIVMIAAPLGAFGAIGYTVGKFGITTLLALLKLVLTAYVTMALFVVIVLGLICHFAGFSLWKILKAIKEELLVALATSSSESVLPQLTKKLEQLGVSRAVVGLVLPTSYSFNLDGVALVLPICVLFIAQVFGVPLSFEQQIGILMLMLLTSKGAAGVTGAAFVTLAATVAATGILPLEGLALVLGVDRFLSEARAITNVTGNVVATLVVGKWQGEFDKERGREILR